MNNINEKFPWDKHSDQPYPLRDKKYKTSMRKKNIKDYIPLIFYNLIIFPLALFFSFVFKSKQKTFPDFFALCVNLDKGEEQVTLVEELKCKNLQIRMPLCEIHRLDEYVSFVKKFKNKNILLTILQDREHIEDKVLLRKDITLIFSAFKGLITQFQIGNAINRSKWGFFSIGEYLEFYKVVQNIRDEDFSSYSLVGPSVIDFEFHFTIRALFNKHDVKYDKLGALLYVDRRGKPENTQMSIFDTSKKISFLHALGKLSLKSSSDILLTETNWPISNTAPYAPTSEKECVSLEDYTNYMLRYYFLALGSKKVQSVYWHQLIAPGYGLVDNRDGLKKRIAFDAYKTMLHFVQGASIENYSVSKDLHVLTCKKDKKSFDIIWCSSDRNIELEELDLVYDKLGKEIKENVKISQSPIYAFHKVK